ncbi:MAG: hypothetical protein ACM3X9_11410 [Bacillota bacterium]
MTIVEALKDEIKAIASGLGISQANAKKRHGTGIDGNLWQTYN